MTTLVLSVPRTGNHFVHNFLFDGQGRIVPVSAKQFLAKQNPISFPADDYLIFKHFDFTERAVIDDLVAEGVKVVVPFRDPMKAMISSVLMNHKGLFPSLDEFIARIDSIPHYKFPVDLNKNNRLQSLNNLLTFTGTTNTSLTKWLAWPEVNSIRPNNSRTEPLNIARRQRYDQLMAAHAAGDVDTIRAFAPQQTDQLIALGPQLRPILDDFGYGVLPWIS